MNWNYINNLYKNQLIIVVTIGIISLAVGAVISIMVARKIAKPLNELANHTEYVASGDLTKEIEATTNDEIGRLAKSFDEMRKQLKGKVPLPM